MFGLFIDMHQKKNTVVKKGTIHPNVTLHITIQGGQYQFHCPLFTTKYCCVLAFHSSLAAVNFNWIHVQQSCQIA